jgi:hypothetical protein
MLGAQIQLEQAALGSLCAGLVLAMFERVTDTLGEHRHRWNDLGDGKAVVIIEKDKITAPPPSRSSPVGGMTTPKHLKNITSELTHILEHAKYSSGVVTIDGIRMAALDAECIIRFSNSASLVVASENPSAEPIEKNAWLWPSYLRNSEVRFYTAMAEATKRAFIRSESLVLALDSNDWIQIGRQHLGARGLGAVLSSDLDEDGTLVLDCTACIHLALLVGTIGGCWQRAMGRKAGVQLIDKKNGLYQIKITPLHTISKYA